MSEDPVEPGQSVTVSQDMPGDQREGPLSLILSHLDLRRQGVLLVLIALGIVFQVATHGIFLSPRNVAQLLRQTSLLGVAACGMTMVIVVGEIDLSIGSAVYLVGMTAAIANIWHGLGTIPTLLISLLIGVSLGLWNGVSIARLRVPAFVATLAGLMGFRGIGLVISDAATIFPTSDSYQALSEGFLRPPYSYVLIGAIYLAYLVITIRANRLGRRSGSRGDTPWLIVQIVLIGGTAAAFAWVTGQFHGIPNAVLILMAVAAVFAFIMGSTVLGRNIYAIGSSREAAALAGISVPRYIVIVFCFMGLVYSISGTLLTARLSGSIAGLAVGLELEAIAAAVIGGTSLMGGVGTIPGTVLGALLLASVDNGMSLMNVSSFLQMVIKAALLFLAVWFDVATRHETD